MNLEISEIESITYLKAQELGIVTGSKWRSNRTGKSFIIYRTSYDPSNWSLQQIDAIVWESGRLVAIQIIDFLAKIKAKEIINI